jgi:hypothetical protein
VGSDNEIIEAATDWNALLSLSRPWAHLATCSERTLDNLLRALALRSQGIVTRILRGLHCETSPDFFREAGAALQFPWYFGHNWDAFNDCINDLDWLPAKHYVIGISRADMLIIRDEKRLSILVESLGHAATAWPSYEPDRDWTKTWVKIEDGTTQWAQRPAASFHVVFQCEADAVSLARNRFRNAGLDLDPVAISAVLPGSSRE